MTIYDFIEVITEGTDVIYRIFDCNTEELVSMDTDEFENATEFNRDDLLYSKYADYEVGGVDMWVGNRAIYVEFNIEIEEEDF